MALLVKKYGGTSVATPEKILNIAKHLKALKDDGNKLIVIVSAMGHFTDELVSLSRQITLTPNQREFDMLLSSGERISTALLSIALQSLGCEAISFTGSQSGVFTDASHNNARITDIKAFRVQEELEKGKIVIVAGFQGVNPVSKEITTLGRGGSDTTAVALACAFKADRCDILTDVQGIYSGDPRINPKAKRLSRLEFDETIEMAYWGASVLHYRCVELAERNATPVGVNTPKEDQPGTLIGSVKPQRPEKVQMETLQITAVNSNSQVARLSFQHEEGPAQAFLSLQKALEKGRLPRPQVLHQQSSDDGVQILITAPQEMFESIQKSLADQKIPSLVERDLATVTMTGRGLVSTGFVFEAVEKLAAAGVNIQNAITTPLSLSFVVTKGDVQKAVQTLHQGFVET